MISKDLFLAILAMDAYNRGYGAGIADQPEDDLDGLGELSDGSVRIGSAIVSKNLEDADLIAEARNAGFYALSYEIDSTGPEDLAGKNCPLVSRDGSHTLRRTLHRRLGAR